MLLITIETFSHPTVAYIRKTSLDAAGIWSFVADENIVIANWLYSIAMGGVKLQVMEEDVEEAYQVLTLIEREQVDEATSMDELSCPNASGPISIIPITYG